MGLGITDVVRSGGESAEAMRGAERPTTRIGTRETGAGDAEAFAAQAEAAWREERPASSVQQADPSETGNAAVPADSGDADRLSDDEVAGAQNQITALEQAKTGRAPNTGDSGRDDTVRESIANDPMVAVHQTSLSQAIGKMQQAVAARDPQALESATKNALQSAKDLDGVRNDHEKNAMTRASLGTSQTSLGETQRQNRFSRVSMGIAGGVGIAGIAVAGTVGGIAANKNLNG